MGKKCAAVKKSPSVVFGYVRYRKMEKSLLAKGLS